MGPFQARPNLAPHKLEIYAPRQINAFPHLAIARRQNTGDGVGRDRSVRRNMGSGHEDRSRSDQQELDSTLSFFTKLQKSSIQYIRIVGSTCVTYVSQVVDP